MARRESLRVRLLGVVLVLCVLAAGCAAPRAGPGTPQTSSGAGEADRFVVALLDSGINPYHIAFQSARPTTQEGDPVLISLSTNGSLEDRLEEDSEIWDSIEVGKLYAFEGTRVKAISFGKRTESALILDDVNHGTGTASMVGAVDPEIDLVMVQVDEKICSIYPPGDCPIFPDLADAMEWIAEQEWIDLVSISLGVPGNPPGDGAQTPSIQRFIDAQRRMHDEGKLIVSGAGNTVTPPFTSYLGGPPWVIAVGGVDTPTRGEELEAGHAPDVVANYTALVADATTVDEFRSRSGTSFSTPLVAGVLASAQRQLEVEGRVADTDLRDALRGAMNRTAANLNPGDWDPAAWVPTNLTSPGAPVLAPGPQTGWGAIDTSHVALIVDAIRTGTAPPKPAAQMRYMETWADAREAYWEQRDGN